MQIKSEHESTENGAGLLPQTQTARAECGAAYLLVTAGEDGNWRSEGQRGFGCTAQGQR